MRIRSRRLTKILAWVAARVVRLLFATCKKVVVEGSPQTNIYNPDLQQRFLYCIWHDSLLMPIFSGKPQHAACLVSRHRDGSYVADAVSMLGLTPVRGSTSRGGAEALHQLITQTEHLHIAITPDGPRGPQRELKQGIIYLASKLKRAIVPTAYGCSRAWVIEGSWTDLVIPKPFSTVYLLGGELHHVPAELSKPELKTETARLQRVMDELHEDLTRLVQGEALIQSRSRRPRRKQAA